MQEFYLARDSQGRLTLFDQKPTKKTYVCNKDFPKYRIEIKGWTTPDYEKYGIGFLVVDKELYPEVTYENSPKKVTFKTE
jgi:hypothetical protein